MVQQLSLIIPCYNEENTVSACFNAIQKIEQEIPLEFEYIFVNDGSTDSTLAKIKALHHAYPASISYLSFSRNFGKEAAIFAGLKASSGEYVTLLDADLQDPPELLIDMWEKIQDVEIDCVAAQRTDRKGEQLLVSASSKLFYKVINKISEVPIVDGVRDFRLMTRQMVDAILSISEVNRFSKGIFAWVGFNTAYVTYANQERMSGQSKWSFKNKVSYAIDGMVNFSAAPLVFATYMGMSIVGVDILIMFILFVRQLVFHNSVSGWTSMSLIILLCFGFLMFTLGIIGRYIADIFSESKNRPIYIIKEKSPDDEKKKNKVK